MSDSPGLQTTTAGFRAPVAMAVGSNSMDGIIYYVLVLRDTPRLPLCKSSQAACVPVPMLADTFPCF